KAMQATIRWVDNATFMGESRSGHSLVMDGPEDAGGPNAGIRPMETLLLAMGGCSAFDAMSIPRKARQHVSDCKVQLTAERGDGIPAVFTRIDLHFIVTGRDLHPGKVERAVKLSAEKYCSASIMLHRAGVLMTHDFEIVND